MFFDILLTFRVLFDINMFLFEMYLYMFPLKYYFWISRCIRKCWETYSNKQEYGCHLIPFFLIVGVCIKLWSINVHGFKIILYYVS